MIWRMWNGVSESVCGCSSLTPIFVIPKAEIRKEKFSKTFIKIPESQIVFYNFSAFHSFQL